jgi:5-methylthioadenosine/S-adenosylhomocysteine deaminase
MNTNTQVTYIKHAHFLTMDADKPFFTGSMAIVGDRIVYLGKGIFDIDYIIQHLAQDHQIELRREQIHVLDLTGHLVMPGLINTHGHAAMSLLRGYSDDEALQVWLEQKMWPNEAKYVKADTLAGTNLALVEMLRSGTTTFLDMYDRMDTVAQAVEAAGMRAVLTRGVIGLSGAEQDAKLAEARALVRDWQGAANGLITTMVSPHAPYTCPPAFIERLIELAHEYNVPLHTHMSETAAEVEQNVRDYGARPVGHLLNLGFFDRPGALVAHAVHLNDAEIEILADKQVAVSHNPASNLKLASGVARVPALLKAGVNVALGTDSAASNNKLDMFSELRLAALLHKGVSGDPTVLPADVVLQMATVNGAKALHLDNVGQLKRGMKADFIALSLDQAHFYPQSNLASHLVYAAGNGADVRHVWIDGKHIVSDGHCLTIDEERVYAEAQLRYEGLIH